MTQTFKTFDEVRTLFPQTVEAIDEQARVAIGQAQAGLETLLSIEAKNRSFENTARALDAITSQFSIAAHPISILEMVSPDESIRSAAREAIIKLEEFSVDNFASKQLYEAFRSYVEGSAAREPLAQEERYFLEETMEDFKRAGLALDDEAFARVQQLKKDLSKKELVFSTNIAADQSKIEVSREGLAGLRDDFIDQLQKTDAGSYILTVDYPTYFEVMEYCGASVTRRDLYRAFNNRAYPANVEILEEVRQLRAQLAREIGYESYAQLTLEEKMVKSPERAEQFIVDLLSKVQKKEEEEFVLLTKHLPDGVVLAADGKLNPWDVSFVKAHVKQKLYDVDEREVAKYFPMEKTVAALFDIYQQFFGLRFEHEKPTGLWHEDVSLIKVFDKEQGGLLGYVFLDLHPRPHKYSHACHAGMVPALEGQPSVGLVIANFPKSTPAKPSLLKHHDVTTFFHEFGHAMHYVLGRTRLASFAGTSVKRDFVEMPSQMFEEWMWDRTMLKQVTGNYETGEPLPDALIDKMVALKQFDSGYHVQRQCCLALLSLALFNGGRDRHSDEVWKEIWEKYTPHIRYEPQVHFQASFGHLMGYGAGYYGYLWSKVFALDFFDSVRKKGLLNVQVGRTLRREVLGKGGSVDPNVLVRTFLGREPTQDAFLRDLGLKGA